MPQMSPIWWMSLMIMFSLTMMFSMNFLYFNYDKKIKTNNTNNFVKMNWTW